MENATRAMIMGATMLLGVMLLALLVWVFTSGGRLGQSYDLRQNRNALTYFNSKLFAYDKVIVLDDEKIADAPGGDYRKADNVFISEGNTISDVVSAINLAYDYNKQFNYDTVNNCEIFICDAKGKMQYYLPNDSTVPQNSVIKANVSNDIFSLNDFLRLHVKNTGPDAELTTDESYPSIKEMKILENGQNFYRYYFETVVHVTEKTKRIDRMAFILVEMTGGDPQTIKLHNSIKNIIDSGFHDYTVKTLAY